MNWNPPKAHDYYIQADDPRYTVAKYINADRISYCGWFKSDRMAQAVTTGPSRASAAEAKADCEAHRAGDNAQGQSTFALSRGEK